jgi:uncharacterized protein YndB with AHSA1/START domain
MATMTGSIITIRGEHNLVLRRTFAATAEQVWRELTDSERLERWIGRWEGDPQSGSVTFFMTAEGQDAPPAEFTIRECEPHERFSGDLPPAAGGWHLWFELEEEDGLTTLTFGQVLRGGEDVGEVGPGWEYYLDRLVASYSLGDVSTVTWDEYFPDLQSEYLALQP